MTGCARRYAGADHGACEQRLVPGEAVAATPAAMERAELLDRVMHNDRRLYLRKALLHFPWRGAGFRRRNLLGCLKAS